jgi:hypothetical protein
VWRPAAGEQSQEVATLVGGLRAEPEKLRACGPRAGDVTALPQVDTNRLAAIGSCFGGSVVLSSREGADLKPSSVSTACWRRNAAIRPREGEVLVRPGRRIPGRRISSPHFRMVRAGGVRDWQVIATAIRCTVSPTPPPMVR